jgi:hypothetical protein
MNRFNIIDGDQKRSGSSCLTAPGTPVPGRQFGRAGDFPYYIPGEAGSQRYDTIRALPRPPGSRVFPFVETQLGLPDDQISNNSHADGYRIASTCSPLSPRARLVDSARGSRIRTRTGTRTHKSLSTEIRVLPNDPPDLSPPVQAWRTPRDTMPGSIFYTKTAPFVIT